MGMEKGEGGTRGGELELGLKPYLWVVQQEMDLLFVHEILVQQFRAFRSIR